MSTAGDDADDFQSITRRQFACGEIRGRHGLAIEFHNHTARCLVLQNEKLLERAGELDWHFVAVGDEGARHFLS